MRAFLLAVPGFLIPYAFVVNPALQGDPLETARVIVTATMGVVMVAAASGGYLLGPLPMILRVLLLCLSPLLISPDATTDLIGAVGLAVLTLIHVGWRRLGRAGTESARARETSGPSARGPGA